MIFFLHLLASNNSLMKILRGTKYKLLILGTCDIDIEWWNKICSIDLVQQDNFNVTLDVFIVAYSDLESKVIR